MPSVDSTRAALGPLVMWACIACGCGANPLNPEAGMPVPKDPGTVVVHVHDGAGAPIANAYVQVTQPNYVGSEFRVGAWTDASGSQTFPAIPAGTRPVEVTPPASFQAGPNGTRQNAQVTKGMTTVVTFILTRDVPVSR